MDDKNERKDEDSENRTHGEFSTGYGATVKADGLGCCSRQVRRAGWSAGGKPIYVSDVLEHNHRCLLRKTTKSEKRAAWSAARVSGRACFVVLGCSLPLAR